MQLTFTIKHLEKPTDTYLRLQKALRHIEQHLDQNISLEELAQLSHFSAFHFQRLFKEMTGETPKQLTQRLRLEEAAHTLVLYPEKSVLEIALNVGFQSLEAFSRAFKNYYGISPAHFRASSEQEKLTIIQPPQLQSKFLKASFAPDSINPADFAQMPIRMVKTAPQNIVYLQTNLANAEQLNTQFERLRRWAQSREIAHDTATMFGLIRDYPLFTALDKCRYWVCMNVNNSISETLIQNNLIGYATLPARTYANLRVSGSLEDLMRAVTYFAHYWLPQSGYKIIHEPALQIPVHNPCLTPFNHNEYDLRVQISAE